MSDTSTLTWSDSGTVATLHFDNSSRRNSLTRDSAEQMALLFETAGASAHCVVLHTAGDTFCSGGDFAELALLADASSEQNRDSVENGFQRLIVAIRDCPVPVVARVQGPAVGAGADLALACDIRVAADSAWLQEAWISSGLVSALGGPLFLTKALGAASALDLLCTGRRVQASECRDLGLFQRVVPPDRLDSAVRELAELLASRDREALVAYKALVLMAEETGLKDVLAASAERQVVQFSRPHFRQAMRQIGARSTTSKGPSE